MESWRAQLKAMYLTVVDIFASSDATEQQILEDFDTGKSAKRHAQECGKKMPMLDS